MHLDSLYSVYELIKDVTPRTTFITCCEDGYRILGKLMERAETTLAAEEIEPSNLRIVLEALNLAELADKITSAIRKMGGTAFVRWDTHYPKDACHSHCRVFNLKVLPKTMNNACLFNTGDEFIALTLNSLRTHGFVSRYGPSILYPAAVRQPQLLKHEFRIVIRNATVKAILQYYYEEDYGLTPEDLETLASELAAFSIEIAQRFPTDSLVLDVGVAEGKPVVVEVTPPPHLAPVSLPGLEGRDKDIVEALYRREQPLLTYRHGGRLVRTTLRFY